MAKALTLELDPRSRRALEKMFNTRSGAEIHSRIRPALRRAALLMAAESIANHASGQAIAARTGGLRQSITGDAVLIHGVPGFRFGIFRGPALRYAGAQEEGTKGINPQSPYPTIVPRRGKALAWPVSEKDGGSGRAVTPAGVARYLSARHYPGPLTFIPFWGSRKAIGKLVDPRDATSEGIARAKATYILLRKLDLKPRRFLLSAFRVKVLDVTKSIGLAIVEAMRGESKK